MNYDYTDIQIINLIDQEHRVSTEKVSESIDIPSRSIRYRIQKLKEKGIFGNKIIITHERKLGLRESLCFIQENPKKLPLLFEILDVNPAIWYIPTMGKYNGSIVHTLDTLDSSNQTLILLKELKRNKIILDFFYTETIDFAYIGWNFDYFNKDGKWTWTWNQWKDVIKKGCHKDKINTIQFNDSFEKINFDYLDIQILSHLYSEEKITLKMIAEKLALSESQISRRIKILEDNGIIKGYRTGFFPFKELITLDCVIKTNFSIDDVIALIEFIPYPSYISYNNKDQIIFEITLPNNELLDFLNAFCELRPSIESQFVQIWQKYPQLNPLLLYDYFKPELNTWDFNKYYEKSLEKMKKLVFKK